MWFDILLFPHPLCLFAAFELVNISALWNIIILLQRVFYGFQFQVHLQSTKTRCCSSVIQTDGSAVMLLYIITKKEYFLWLKQKHILVSVTWWNWNVNGNQETNFFIGKVTRDESFNFHSHQFRKVSYKVENRQNIMPTAKLNATWWWNTWHSKVII